MRAAAPEPGSAANGRNLQGRASLVKTSFEGACRRIATCRADLPLSTAAAIAGEAQGAQQVCAAQELQPAALAIPGDGAGHALSEVVFRGVA